MAKSVGITRKILIWSYDRGTLPYDIVCAVILAFIFLVPRSCFIQKKSLADKPQAAQAATSSESGARHSEAAQPQK